MFHIVRAFDNDEVLHVDDSIDPVRDLGQFRAKPLKRTELIWYLIFRYHPKRTL